MVDSWLDAYAEGSWAQPGGAFAVTEEGRLPLIRWLADVWLYRTNLVERAFDRHDPHRRLLVRYEDLLADPTGHLDAICDRLSLEVPKRRLAGIADAHDFSEVGRRGSRRQVRSANPGSWRENLDATEQDALMGALGQKLDALGYGPGSGRAAAA